MPKARIQTMNTIRSSEEASTSANVSIFSDSLQPPEELLHIVVSNGGRRCLLIIIILNIFVFFYGINLLTGGLYLPKNFEIGDNNTNAKDNSGEYPLTGCNATENTYENFTYPYDCKYSIIKRWEFRQKNKRNTLVGNILWSCGLALGFIVLGFETDRSGRKKVLFVSLVFHSLLGFFLVTTQSYSSFIFIRFFYGMSLAGTAIGSLVLGCELTSNRRRSFILGLFFLSMFLGIALISHIWIIFLLRKTVLIILCTSQILLIVLIKIVMESPSWLLVIGNFAKAEYIIQSMAKFNNQSLEPAFKVYRVHIIASKRKTKNYFWCLLKPSATRWLTLAIINLWIIVGLQYGLIMQMILMQNISVFDVTRLVGLIGVVTATLNLGLTCILSHKIIITLSAVFGYCTIICAYFIKYYNMHNVYKLLSFGLFLTSFGLYSLSICTLWIVTPRSFPTEMRGQATGIAIGLGSISFAICKMTFPCIATNIFAFVTVSSIFTAAIAICVTFIFSVHNRELPEVLNDSVEFKRYYKPIRWSSTRPTLEESEMIFLDFEPSTLSSE